MSDYRRWQCQECRRICRTDALLHAPNPSDPQHSVVGCSNCSSVDSFVAACDIEGCEQMSGSGTPTKDGSYGGYTYRCHEHRIDP